MGHMRWKFLIQRALQSPVQATSKQFGLRYSTQCKSFKGPSQLRSQWSYLCGNGKLSSQSASQWMQLQHFSVALNVEQPPPETSTQVEPEENVSSSVSEEASLSSETDAKPSDPTAAEVKCKKEKKERFPAEVAIPRFFDRVKLVEQIADILKKNPWGEETKKALQELSVPFDTQLITQILRIRFPSDVALDFFHWLKDDVGFKHNEYTYGVMLNALGRSGNIAQMRELYYREMKAEGIAPTPVNVSCVMHWMARAGQPENVAFEWGKLKREGKKPSLGIYTAYLDMLIRAKRFTKIPPLYEMMLSEECLPNNKTYTLLIQHLADAGRLRAAVNVLEIMQKLHVVPSRVAYEFIICGYVKEGNVDKVQELLNEMRERFHRPSKRLKPAIQALQEAGKIEEARILKEEILAEDSEELLQDEEQTGQDISGASDDILDSLMCEWRDVTSLHVGFDVNSFAQALHAWNPQVEEALNQANVQWRSSLVLEVLRRLRNLETSWPFFHWVKNRSGFKHDRYSCMVMIQRILKSKSPIERTSSLVNELFEEMKKDGIMFTVPMFNMMIRYYVLAHDIDRAIDMFNQIIEHQLQPNAASYSPIVQLLAKDRQGKKAMEMFQGMKDAGFCPDSVTCAELITCLDLAERLPSAYELFCKIPETGREPTGLEYKAIMSAYSRSGDQSTALKLYEQMRGAGIAPTQDMFDQVGVILRKANRTSDINAIANFRKKLKFFGGRKKAVQEDLLKVLDLFMRAMKPRANNAYKRPFDCAAAEDNDDKTAAEIVAEAGSSCTGNVVGEAGSGTMQV